MPIPIRLRNPSGNGYIGIPLAAPGVTLNTLKYQNFEVNGKYQFTPAFFVGAQYVYTMETYDASTGNVKPKIHSVGLMADYFLSNVLTSTAGRVSEGRGRFDALDSRRGVHSRYAGAVIDGHQLVIGSRCGISFSGWAPAHTNVVVTPASWIVQIFSLFMLRIRQFSLKSAVCRISVQFFQTVHVTYHLTKL